MGTEQTITVQKVRMGSIFKLLFIGLTTWLLPLCIALGIAAYFGADTVTWNKQHLYGLQAVMLSPVIGLMAASLFTLITGSLVCLGLWAYSFARPLTLRIVVSEQK